MAQLGEERRHLMAVEHRRRRGRGRGRGEGGRRRIGMTLAGRVHIKIEVRSYFLLELGSNLKAL
jgi:hypothetical protein